MKAKQQTGRGKSRPAERKSTAGGADRKPLRLQPDKKISPKDKRRLARAVGKAKRDGKILKTAQQTIPYQEMYRDGICRAEGNFYTKQMEFLDINYQLARNEDKNAIFENWCDFLNYFDSSIRFQFSFLNQRTDLEGICGSIRILEQEDSFNSISL